MGTILRKIDRNGRLVIPYTMRNAMGLTPNQQAQIELSGSMLIVTAPALTKQKLPHANENAPISQALLTCLAGLDEGEITFIMNIANGLKAL